MGLKGKKKKGGSKSKEEKKTAVKEVKKTESKLPVYNWIRVRLCLCNPPT